MQADTLFLTRIALYFSNANLLGLQRAIEAEHTAVVFCFDPCAHGPVQRNVFLQDGSCITGPRFPVFSWEWVDFGVVFILLDFGGLLPTVCPTCQRHFLTPPA